MEKIKKSLIEFAICGTLGFVITYGMLMIYAIKTGC